MVPSRSQSATAVLITFLALAGCAPVPASLLPADHTARSRQADAALRDARAEAEALRADVASARIAAAKQEAELHELRRRILELEHAVDARQAELVTLRTERDRLAQSATIAQVRVADPGVPTNADEITALKGKLRDLEAVLASLAAELAQVKKEMRASPASSPTRGEETR